MAPNERARLIDVLMQLLPFIGYPRTLNGLQVVNEALPPAGHETAATATTGHDHADTQTR
jgi:hypothetical protein